jgi:hypothetical protein
MDNVKDRAYTVYVRAKWQDKWEKRDDIEPLNCSQAISPGVGKAQLLLRYGQGEHPGGLKMVNGDKIESLRLVYVQIRTFDDEDVEIVLWTGWASSEQFSTISQAGTIRTADQVVNCECFDTLLDLRVDGADTLRPGDATVYHIDWLPTFNETAERGPQVLGNRSSSFAGSTGRHAFVKKGQLWSLYDILLYLIIEFNSRSDTGDALFNISISAAVRDSLKKIEDVFDFSNDTIRSALNKLLPRNKGFYWTPILDDVQNVILLLIDTTLDTGLVYDDTTIPAAENQSEIQIWDDRLIDDVSVAQVTNNYDKIVVRGQRIKSCFSLRATDNDLTSEIFGTWDADALNEYYAAASGEDGYAELDETEQANLNDAVRSRDRVAEVYTRFGPATSWDWKAGGNPVNPVIEAGAVKTAGAAVVQANYWNAQKRLLPFLPLFMNVDYSVSGATDYNAADAGKEFRKMFVLLKRPDGKYVYADNVGYAAASIRPLANDLHFEVKFKPAYILAKEFAILPEFAPGSFAVESLAEYGFSFKEMIATVCVECDNYLSAQWPVLTAEQIAAQEEAGLTGPQRILTIDVPDCEFWYVAPATVVDIDTGGALKVFGAADNIIRNDYARLNAILQGIVAEVGKSRNKLSFKVRDTLLYDTEGKLIREGYLLKNVRIKEDDRYVAGSIITSMQYDLAGGSLSITTDFNELDFYKLYGTAGSSTIPNLKAAGREIDKIKKEIKSLKADAGAANVRSGGVAGTAAGTGAGGLNNIKILEIASGGGSEGNLTDTLKVKLDAIVGVPWDFAKSDYAAGNIASYDPDPGVEGDTLDWIAKADYVWPPSTKDPWDALETGYIEGDTVKDGEPVVGYIAKAGYVYPTNPFDPETEPDEYAAWTVPHPADDPGNWNIWSDYSPPDDPDNWERYYGEVKCIIYGTTKLSEALPYFIAGDQIMVATYDSQLYFLGYCQKWGTC